MKKKTYIRLWAQAIHTKNYNKIKPNMTHLSKHFNFISYRIVCVYMNDDDDGSSTASATNWIHYWQMIYVYVCLVWMYSMYKKHMDVFLSCSLFARRWREKIVFLNENNWTWRFSFPIALNFKSILIIKHQRKNIN